jgi:hypothetical protein
MWLKTPRGLVSLGTAIARFDLRRDRLRVDVDFGSVVAIHGTSRSTSARVATRSSTPGVEDRAAGPTDQVDGAVRQACAFLGVAPRRPRPPIVSREAPRAAAAPHLRGARAARAPSRRISRFATAEGRASGTGQRALGRVRLCRRFAGDGVAEIDPRPQDRIRLCAPAADRFAVCQGQWDYAVKTHPDVPATGRIRRRQRAGGRRTTRSAPTRSWIARGGPRRRGPRSGGAGAGGAGG